MYRSLLTHPHTHARFLYLALSDSLSLPFPHPLSISYLHTYTPLLTPTHTHALTLSHSRRLSPTSFPLSPLHVSAMTCKCFRHATYSFRSPCHLVWTRRQELSAKEPYTSAKEPHLSAKESCISLPKSPISLQKNPNLCKCARVHTSSAIPLAAPSPLCYATATTGRLLIVLRLY